MNHRLTAAQIAVQSAAIHPEWNPSDHAHYMVNDEFLYGPDQYEAVTSVLRDFMKTRKFIEAVVSLRTRSPR